MTPLDLHSPRGSLASSPTSPQGWQGSRNIYTDCKIWYTSPWGGGTRRMPTSACAIENYSKSIWKTKVAVWVIHFRESGSPRDFPADKCLLISTVAAEEWGNDHNEGLWGFPGDLGVLSSNHRLNIDDKGTSELIWSKPREDKRFTQHDSESGAMMGLEQESMFIIILILLFPTQINFTTDSS